MILSKLLILTKREMRTIMRKTFIALGIFLTVNTVLTHIPSTVQAQQKSRPTQNGERSPLKKPKQNTLTQILLTTCMKVVKLEGNSTIEKFKLWLRDGEKEFGVFVRIEYTTQTEAVVNIDLQETSR